MAASVKVGRFQLTGTPQSITGVGFEPKFILIFSPSLGSQDATAVGCTLVVNLGSENAATSNRLGIGWTSNRNTFTNRHFGAANYRLNEVISEGEALTNGTIVSVNYWGLTSFDADGFTMTAGFYGGNTWHDYIAIGGSSVTVFDALSQNCPTSPGTQAWNGPSSQPSLAFVVSSDDASNKVFRSFGWVDGNNNQGVVSLQGDYNVATSLIHKYQSDGHCVAMLNTATGAIDGRAVATMTPTGLSMNWTEAPAVARNVRVFMIAGIDCSAVSFLQRTSAGTSTVALDVFPQAVMLMSYGATASHSAASTGQRLTIGISDGNGIDKCTWNGDESGTTNDATRRNLRRAVSNRALYLANPTSNTVATMVADATVNNFGSGTMDVVYGTADATQREILALAFGNAIAAPEPAPDEPDYDITIGDETGINPLLETFRIQETLDGNTTAVMDIDSDGSGSPAYTRFTLNDSVVVTENGTRIFGGVVTGLRERAFGGVNGGAIVVEVQATSYSINAKRRYLTSSTLAGSPSLSLGDWLQSLIDDYLGAVGVTLHPDQVDGPTLEAFLFERELISEAINKVTESVGYLWSIDYTNQLRAWAPGDLDAPEDIDESTTEVLTGDVEKEEQLAEGYANHVTIVGEGILVPDHSDPFTGDGSEDTFPLTYKIVGPYPYTPDGQGAVAFGVVLYADGTTESIAGLNAPPGFIWEYDPVNVTIRRRSGPVANGVNFSMPYHGLFEPNAVAFDAGEIATYGLWEYVESVTSVPTDLSAQGLADAILAKRLASKDEFVTYQTRDLGYRPGQLQTLVVPSRVVSGEFLITQVETFAEQDSQVLVRRVKTAKSLNNDADWRKVYRQWYGVGGSSSSSTTSAVSDSGAGAGLGLHAAHHELGGIDPIKLDDLDTPDDNTDLDVSTSAHGLVPKLSGSDGFVLTKVGGVADWEAPTGGGSPAFGITEICQTIRVIGVITGATIAVNNTGYISNAAMEFSVDTTFFPFTHFRILISGASSEAAQTITAQLATGFGSPTTPVHTGGNDVVITNTGALWDSGYRTKDVSDSGINNYIIALKGSNGTVDLGLTHASVILKIDN